MSRYFKQIVLLVFYLLAVRGSLAAQAVSGVQEIAAGLNSFGQLAPSEKVFIHLDRPYYTNTDTVWTKAYLLNEGLGYSAKSSLLYTELINDTGKVVMRLSLPVRNGLSFGQIALDSNLIAEGTYTLRAYTNWMQNTGPEAFFTRQLYIGKTDENALLAKMAISTGDKNAKGNTDASIQLLMQDGSPAILKKIHFKLTDDRRTWLNQNLQTDFNGKVKFAFNLPDKRSICRLVFTMDYQNQAGARNTMLLPVPVNRPERTDVQFMPEGGYLVSGLMSRVGFKVTSEDGKGADVKGEVLDSKNNVVATLQTLHKGMGSFMLTPAEGETYTATVTLPGGIRQSYPLPKVKPSGMVMSVVNLPGRSQVTVVIQRSPDVAETAGYALVAQSGGQVSYAAGVNFKPGSNSVSAVIDKQRFTGSLTRFTLFSAQKQPLAERLIYTRQHNRLKIAITANRQGAAADSAGVSMLVTDDEGKPVQGSFSVAVTDNSQVKTDSMNVADLATYMLLTGNLKGEVEDPGYYFTGDSTEKADELDALLLTQGWVADNWKTVFDKSYTPKFLPEAVNRVTGRVFSGTKPLPDIKVTMLSVKKPLLFRDTVTDHEGRFRFSDLPRIDSPSFIVQAVSKNGRVFESTVQLDEFVPPQASTGTVPRLTPWYANIDSTLLNYNKQNVARKKQFELYDANGIRLKEVVIKGRKVVKGSSFYAGAGTLPDIVVDEKEMISARKMPLEELLAKRIGGFGPRIYGKRIIEYMVNGYLMFLYIDGFELDNFYDPFGGSDHNRHFNYIKSFLTPLTAEDVRGIEVKTALRMIVLPDDPKRQEHMERVAYVEITTWAGNGAIMKRVNGRALYRPLPVSWPKTFYQPKYTAANKGFTDLPATLFWAPNVITDTSGKAILSFSLPKNKAFTVVVNGADLNGKVGYERIKLGL